LQESFDELLFEELGFAAVCRQPTAPLVALAMKSKLNPSSASQLQVAGAYASGVSSLRADFVSPGTLKPGRGRKGESRGRSPSASSAIHPNMGLSAAVDESNLSDAGAARLSPLTSPCHLVMMRFVIFFLINK
jgi:hypothetical protein